MEDLFDRLESDPENVYDAQIARIGQASPTLRFHVETATSDWKMEKKAVLAACISRLKSLPPIAVMAFDPGENRPTAYLKEVERMPPDITSHLMTLPFSLLRDPADRLDVQIAFCEIHRIARLYAKAPDR